MPLVYLLATHWDTSSPTGTCGPCIRGPVRICPMPIGLHRNEWFSLGHCCSTWAILFVWRDGCGIMPMIHLIQCHVLPFLPFFCYLILGPFTRFACGWYTFVAFVIFCVFFDSLMISCILLYVSDFSYPYLHSPSKARSNPSQMCHPTSLDSLSKTMKEKQHDVVSWFHGPIQSEKSKSVINLLVWLMQN